MVKDTVISGVDTLKLIHTKVKVWIKAKKRFSFEVGPGDTILYSLQKQNNTRMKYKVIKPNEEEKEYVLSEDIKNMPLETGAGAGNYTLEFKNQSFKTNYVVIDLKNVKSWKRIEKLKKEPPKQDSVSVVIYDTIPRVVLEDTYYIGAKKNIKAGFEKVIAFEFVADSVPCYWSYLVGFGKKYQEDVNGLVNLETQQPVGDPLVAYFNGRFQSFLPSQSNRAKLSLKGPGVDRHFATTDFDTTYGRKGAYQLSLTNKDEVVGEYVYFKVVAFDFVKKEEIKVPVSEYKKMKIAKCSSK
ncbi:hypothetical protein C900_02990 [Fulvivirga imtechensis AK7]|uniref:Uncharacterized protein n=1 Tax=Fulvivirga imtechensis AK7 TaxID=1237149 RepID=L8JQF4_9BACT|nr:hypothetical protein C900_02990 [Fulvivirga imtechensis AK7]